MNNSISLSNTAVILKVSDKYLVNTIVPSGELKPIDNSVPMRFLESDVLAYLAMDVQRRKDALKRLAEAEDGLLD